MFWFVERLSKVLGSYWYVINNNLREIIEIISMSENFVVGSNNAFIFLRFFWRQLLYCKIMNKIKSWYLYVLSETLKMTISQQTY